MNMHPSTSKFLDALRFTAAVVVLFGHGMSRDFNLALPWMIKGGNAVVAFFVTSGFVIAYVATARENSGAQYIAARLSRLYSVVLPALLLTAILDMCGRNATPSLYEAIPNDHPTLRLLINGLFLQQNWNLTVIPLSNGPFWSLGYEFWYYAIFGAWNFQSGRKRVALVILLCALAGPRIIAYFPLWLLGVYAFRNHNSRHAFGLHPKVTFGIALISIAAILSLGNPLILFRLSLQSIYPTRFVNLGGFDLFLGDIPHLPGDFLLAISIALLIHGSRGLGHWIYEQKLLSKSITYLAGATFSIYLFHAPLLYFLHATLKTNKDSSSDVIVVTVITLIACLILSYIGERRVAIYRRVFSSLISVFMKRFTGFGLHS